MREIHDPSHGVNASEGDAYQAIYTAYDEAADQQLQRLIHDGPSAPTILRIATA